MENRVAPIGVLTKDTVVFSGKMTMKGQEKHLGETMEMVAHSEKRVAPLVVILKVLSMN